MASADLTPSASSFPNASTPASAPSAAHDAASVLQNNLARLASRRNALRMWGCLARALAWGIGVAVVMILAYRFYLVDGPLWLPVIPILLSILIGWRNGTLARGNTFEAALEADEKLELKEHLSSAFAFVRPEAVSRSQVAPAGNGALARLRAVFAPRLVTENAIPIAPTTLVPSLVQDAAVRSQTLAPAQLYPLRFDHAHRLLALVALHLLVVALMPNVPWLLSEKDKVARGVIATQGEELIKVAKEIQKEQPKDAQENAEAKRLARKMEALGRKMQRGRMGKKEALTSLGELKKDLEKAAKNDGANQNSGSDLKNMQAALEQLADQPMDSEAGKKVQDELKKGNTDAAAKEMEKLAEKLENGQMSQEEKQKAANDLEKMAKSLKQQGGEQNQKMAEQLEQAAQALKQQSGKGQQQKQNQQGQEGKGQQGQSGGQTQSQQSGGAQGAANALRQMAKGMRQGGSQSNSQQLREMLKKIEQAENETGSNNSGQAGQGNCPNCGQGNCPGGKGGSCPFGGGGKLKPNDPHGPVGGGPGLGPRNNSTGSAKGGGVSKEKSKRTGDKRRWEDVWSDRVPSTRKKIDRVQGKYGDEGEMEQLPTKTEAKGGPVKTPYYEVYESYNKDAEDAINKENVPPAYKQPVKDYFESIKPN